MYLGSNEFNNAIENTQGNAPKIRVTLEDGTTLDNIKSIKFYGGSNDSDDISIGTTNMARIDVTAFTDRLLTNNEIFLEQGIELANGVVEYMPIGYFTVQKPSGDFDEVMFTAYDRMQKFEKPYSSSLAYPTTSALILSELCQISGVELATPIENPIEVTENLKGYTCREVLGYIASMHSSFACIDRYGRLNVRWYSDTPIEKSLKKIWHFEKSQDNFEIAKVEIAKDSETNYASGNGITTLHNSNPLATQEITDGIFAKLGGFAYSVGEIEMLDDARLDPWDMVSVEYYDGKTYIIPCMALEHDFKAYSTTVKSVGKSESENEYRFTGPTIQYLNRMATELLVANRVIATKVDAEYVNSHAITTENFDAKVAEIQKLIVKEIDGKYANIDLANIDIADIGRFYADSGLIKDVVIVDGHITGVLDAVTINANNITSGTLTTDRLVIRGTDKSIVYELNNIDGALQAVDVNTLNGEIITPRTINADRIVAESITSNEIATDAITANKIASHSITADKLNVDNLSAINANLGTVTAGLLLSSDYNTQTGEGMKIDLSNSKIVSRSTDFVTIFNSEGHYMGYTMNAQQGVFFTPDFDTMTGQGSVEITNGRLTLNSVNYGSSGISYSDVNILNWTTEGIATPRLCTDLIYCNGDAVAKNIVCNNVQTATYTLNTVGAMAVQNKQDIATINSNLSRKGVVFLANTTQQTDTTYTVESLKNFHLLLLTVGYRGLQSRGTIIVPTVHFINSGYINAQFYNEATNEHISADCTYISDTSVSMKTTHTNQWGALYGIKL